LKLSKSSRIVAAFSEAFSHHNKESQMVTIVTVTMWYLGKLGQIMGKLLFKFKEEYDVSKRKLKIFINPSNFKMLFEN
jgi:hypothetical protein